MRRPFALVLLIVLGTMPLQTSAQASVPAADLQCVNSYQDNAIGPSEPMGYIDSSYSNGNTTMFSPINCTVSNSNSYAERIQIQVSAEGLTLSAPGTIDIGPNANESFYINASAEQGMAPGIVILNVTATVVEANGLPPPNIAKGYSEGEIWIINDEWVEPEPHETCYTTYTPEMMHAANNWRFVDLIMQYTNNESVLTDGTIRIQLNHSAAPLHSENFALLALMGCYDNVSFHRVIEGFMIQGGDFEMNMGAGGYTAKWYGYCNGKTTDDEGVNYTAETCQFNQWSLPSEHTNGLRHGVGSLAAAHAGLNTDGSQFYIVPTGSNPCWLDGDQVHAGGGSCIEDTNKDCSSLSCHTVFGQVTLGQNHVDAIAVVNTGQSDKPVENVTIINAILTNGTDSDNDGLPDDIDAFPNDANETTDSDEDGVGDNSDAFPNDANETHDDDGDGLGNNSDAFPDDPDETHDDDGDGVGNNTDEFPQDPDEQFDNDGDGVGNNADDFPDNAYASNWSTIYAAVGTLIVLLIGAGVMISRMKKEDELPNVPASNELEQLEKEIAELEKRKAEVLGQQDLTESMFED